MKHRHEVLKAFVPFGYEYRHRVYLEFRVLKFDFNFSIKWIDGRSD